MTTTTTTISILVALTCSRAVHHVSQPPWGCIFLTCHVQMAQPPKQGTGGRREETRDREMGMEH
eukprot:7334596-Pyramimonas_sp.AAC.1